MTGKILILTCLILGGGLFPIAGGVPSFNLPLDQLLISAGDLRSCTLAGDWEKKDSVLYAQKGGAVLTFAPNFPQRGFYEVWVYFAEDAPPQREIIYLISHPDPHFRAESETRFKVFYPPNLEKPPLKQKLGIFPFFEGQCGIDCSSISLALPGNFTGPQIGISHLILKDRETEEALYSQR